MDERILKWLYDIKIAISEIDGYFLEHQKDFFKYRQNLMLKRAVERDLEIIGEAMNRILSQWIILPEIGCCVSWDKATQKPPNLDVPCTFFLQFPTTS